MFKSDVVCVEEGSDMFPDMVDAVGLMAPEKPSLFVNFRVADLLGVEVKTISH